MEEHELWHHLEHEFDNLWTQEVAWLKEQEKLIAELEAEQQVEKNFQVQLVTPPHTTSSNLVNPTDISYSQGSTV